MVTRIGKGGRVVIPSRYRRSLGIEPGDEVIVTLEEDSVRIQTPARAMRRAQELVRSYVKEGHSLVDELLADREEESRAAVGKKRRRRSGSSRRDPSARRRSRRTGSGRASHD